MTGSADWPGWGGRGGKVFNNVLFDAAKRVRDWTSGGHTFHPIEKWYPFCIPSLENCISPNQKVFLVFYAAIKYVLLQTRKGRHAGQTSCKKWSLPN